MSFHLMTELKIEWNEGNDPTFYKWCLHVPQELNHLISDEAFTSFSNLLVGAGNLILNLKHQAEGFILYTQWIRKSSSLEQQRIYV